MAQQVQDLAEAANEALSTGTDPAAIDWTNFKKILASFITNFGPVLLPIILGFLETQPSDD